MKKECWQICREMFIVVWLWLKKLWTMLQKMMERIMNQMTQKFRPLRDWNRWRIPIVRYEVEAVITWRWTEDGKVQFVWKPSSRPTRYRSSLQHIVPSVLQTLSIQSLWKLPKHYYAGQGWNTSHCWVRRFASFVWIRKNPALPSGLSRNTTWFTDSGTFHGGIRGRNDLLPAHGNLQYR